VSEFDDGDTLRPEEEKKRDDPEPDGDAAIGRDGRDYVEIEDGNYEQENEIAASQGADQVGLGDGLGGGGQSCFETPRFALVDSPFDCAQGKLRRLFYIFRGGACRANKSVRPAQANLVRG
jgi:hypothetical protein